MQKGQLYKERFRHLEPEDKVWIQLYQVIVGEAYCNLFFKE